MPKSKYIIVNIGNIPTAFVFPAHVQHSEYLRLYSRSQIVGAGFCEFSTWADKVIVQVFGHSQSLELQSKDEDAEVIARMMNAEAGKAVEV